MDEIHGTCITDVENKICTFRYPVTFQLGSLVGRDQFKNPDMLEDGIILLHSFLKHLFLT
jgi:hypothetical protein